VITKMTIVITVKDARTVKKAVEIADRILELMEQKKKIEKRIEELKQIFNSLDVEIKEEGDGNGSQG